MKRQIVLAHFALLALLLGALPCGRLNAAAHLSAATATESAVIIIALR